MEQGVQYETAPVNNTASGGEGGGGGEGDKYKLGGTMEGTGDMRKWGGEGRGFCNGAEQRSHRSAKTTFQWSEEATIATKCHRGNSSKLLSIQGKQQNIGSMRWRDNQCTLSKVLLMKTMWNCWRCGGVHVNLDGHVVQGHELY